MISHELNIRQGYNFNKNQQSSYGFVKKLRIENCEFPADQEVTQLDTKMKVLGVLKRIEWDPSITKPIIFEMQVSIASRRKIQQLLLKDLNKNSVEIDFVTYEFDFPRQVFYKSFHANDSSLKGGLKKVDEKFFLHISDTPSPEILQPINYCLTLGFVAQGKQEVHLATSATNKFVKQIGMSVD